MTKLKLNCYVRGDDSLDTFSVNIDEDDDVSNLRHAIKEKKKLEWGDIPDYHLRLWKTSLPYNKNLKGSVDALSLVEKDCLEPVKFLFDIFTASDLVGDASKKIHIIVDRKESGHQRSALPSSSPSDPFEKKATEKAWKVGFKGGSAELFRKCLDDMNKGRGGKLYANFVSIIQSSGMGKSRLVDEIAKLIFTIPFCFRSESNGYPEPDEAPRNFFRLKNGEDFEIVFDRVLLFLEQLFIAVKSEVEKLSKKGKIPLPKLWYDNLLEKNNRQNLYLNVVAATEKFLKDTERTRHTLSDKGGKDQPVYTAAKALIDTIKGYIDEDSSVKNSRPVRLLIYIDESHEMTTSAQTIKGGEHNVYQILCSSLNKLLELDLFFVFLSTNSNLSDYSPAARVSWSARGRNSNLFYLQAPYTELPFDVWKEPHIVKENQFTMNYVCSLEFIVRFGRPLWWTRWEEGDVTVRNDFVEFVMMKLSAQSNPINYTSETFLAAMSVRLMLDFEPRRITAIETENLMVAGHLRVANVIPIHRKYMFSSTPSEPIVAEAAAQVLRQQNMITLLYGHVSGGLIEKGQRGELAARLLLTLAHDAALRKLPVKSDQYQGRIERLFTAPVPLLSFLDALFTSPRMVDIMGSRPDNQPNGPTFQESFEDAYIMFTHFGKAADDWCISDKFAFMALTRNMAIACQERTKSVDICIPIHFGEKEPLSRHTTSAILISIKDKGKAMGYTQTHINVDEMNFFSDETKQRPVVNLVLQLGVQPPGRYTTIKQTTKQQTPGLLSTPQRRTRGGKEVPKTHASSSMSKIFSNIVKPGPKTRAEGRTPGPAYYTIDMIGCNSEVYGVVKKEEEHLWRALLASSDFFTEHSRQETGYLRAVLAQKPIWTSGEECCLWANVDPES